MSRYYYENCFHYAEPLKGSGEPAGSRLHFENLRLADSLNIVERVGCVHGGQMGTLRLREGKDWPAVSLEGTSSWDSRPAPCALFLASFLSEPAVLLQEGVRVPA